MDSLNTIVLYDKNILTANAPEDQVIECHTYLPNSMNHPLFVLNFHFRFVNSLFDPVTTNRL